MRPLNDKLKFDMKTAISYLMACLAITSARAEFRTWTRADGKTADLDLVAVAGTGPDQTGDFKTRAGAVVKLKGSALAATDAKALDEWKPAAAETTAAAPSASVFDK